MKTKTKSINDLKAYKLFVENNEKWLYGEIRNETYSVEINEEVRTLKHPEIALYQFDITKNFIIYVEKDEDVKDDSLIFKLCEIPTEALILTVDTAPVVTNDYDVDSGFVMQFKMKNITTTDEKEAFEIFMNHVYKYYPLNSLFRCHRAREKYAMYNGNTNIAHNKPTIIVCEKIPNFNTLSYNYDEAFTDSNYMSIKCFDLLYSCHYSTTLKPTTLSTFSDRLNNYFSSKIQNVVIMWQCCAIK